MQKNSVDLEEQGDAQGSSGEVDSGDPTTILVSNGDQVSPKKSHLSRRPMQVPSIVAALFIFDFVLLWRLSSGPYNPCSSCFTTYPILRFLKTVCNGDKDEDLIELGCQCRDGLAKARRTCIYAWFQTRGSNKCQMCQRVAETVPPPESQPSGGLKPDCVASTFLILLLLFMDVVLSIVLDVLISIVFGVSSLSVNIIIGIGTDIFSVLVFVNAIWIAWQFCKNSRRVMQEVETNVNLG